MCRSRGCCPEGPQGGKRNVAESLLFSFEEFGYTSGDRTCSQLMRQVVLHSLANQRLVSTVLQFERNIGISVPRTKVVDDLW